MMKVVETTPKSGTAILPGADFADAWRVGDLAAGSDAETIVKRFFARSPRWVGRLLRLRNFLIAPFGLKTGTSGQSHSSETAFPVVSSQPNRVVLGFDDRHLDFRLVIDVEALDRERLSATATTYVRTHNLGGRLYLMAVRPFHRVIVPAMLASAARNLA